MPIGKNDILNADDLPRESIPVPEWGGELLVRGLSGADAMRLFREHREADNDMSEFAMAEWIAVAAVDKDGAKLFEPDDVPELAGKSFAVLKRVFEELLTLNGLSEDAQADAEKN